MRMTTGTRSDSCHAPVSEGVSGLPSGYRRFRPGVPRRKRDGGRPARRPDRGRARSRLLKAGLDVAAHVSSGGRGTVIGADAYAVASAVAFGLSDFCAGLGSRRKGSWWVTVVSLATSSTGAWI